MYGFSTNGTEKFFNDELEQYDQWTPTYYQGTVYSWVAGEFRAHDPLTGAVLWMATARAIETLIAPRLHAAAAEADAFAVQAEANESPAPEPKPEPESAEPPVAPAPAIEAPAIEAETAPGPSGEAGESPAAEDDEDEEEEEEEEEVTTLGGGGEEPAAVSQPSPHPL